MRLLMKHVKTAQEWQSTVICCSFMALNGSKRPNSLVGSFLRSNNIRRRRSCFDCRYLRPYVSTAAVVLILHRQGGSSCNRRVELPLPKASKTQSRSSCLPCCMWFSCEIAGCATCEVLYDSVRVANFDLGLGWWWASNRILFFFLCFNV